MSIKLESNTHFSKAKFLQEGVHQWQSEAGETEATMICTALDAVIESNLAIAYEARTENMLTLLGQMQDLELTKEGEAQANKLAEVILERLDLGLA